MSDERFIQQIQSINVQMEILYKCMIQLPQQQQFTHGLEEIAISLDNLQLIYEQMQTSLEAAEVVEAQVLGRLEGLTARHQYYFSLFQLAPIAYLLTDKNGLILEGNQAAARLLNVPKERLIRKPLAVFVPEAERQYFRTRLNQLSQISEVQDWEINLRPRQGEVFAAELKVAVLRDDRGIIEGLLIAVHDISRYKQMIAQPLQQREEQEIEPVETAVASLPRSLDGLQVLIVDDEADAREFIVAVLESHGICVTAVATAAAALDALERFRPDVLVSDIRMPDDNGYSLIRKIRELEAEKGWHIPAAALTAYLTEDRETALAAGFESHLHKLAQPTELVEMVARLAGRV